MVLEPDQTMLKQLVTTRILEQYTNSTVRQNSRRHPHEVLHFYTSKNVKFAQINFHTDHLRLHLNSRDEPQHFTKSDPQLLTKIIKALHDRPEGPFVIRRKHK